MNNTVQKWFEDPEFLKLPFSTKKHTLSNYFDEELTNEKFYALPKTEQTRVRNNFVVMNMAPHMPEAPERGWIGDIGSALAGGVLGAAETGLRVARTVGDVFVGEEPEEEEWTTRGLEKLEDIRMSSPFLRPSKEARSGVRRWVYEGLQSTVQSILAQGPATAVGFFAMGGVPGAIAMYALSGGSLYGVAARDEFLERADARGIDRKVSEPAALKHALAEGGFEFATDLLEAATAGVARPFTRTGKEALKNGIKALLKQRASTIAARVGGVAAAETIGEMATAGTQAEIAHGIDLGDERFWSAAKNAFGPSLVAGLIFGGMGAGINTLQRRDVQQSLVNPETNKKKRMQAVVTVGKELNSISPDIARVWTINAAEAVQDKKPISMDGDLVETSDVKDEVSKDAPMGTNAQGVTEVGQKGSLEKQRIKREQDRAAEEELATDAAKEIVETDIKQAKAEESAAAEASLVEANQKEIDRIWEEMRGAQVETAAEEVQPASEGEIVETPGEVEITKRLTELEEVLSPGQISFIQNKVGQLGSPETVAAEFNADDNVSEYANLFAWMVDNEARKLEKTKLTEQKTEDVRALQPDPAIASGSPDLERGNGKARGESQTGIRKFTDGDIVGKISDVSAQEINKLGFSTKTSDVVIPQRSIDYIDKSHGKQLTDEDIDYIKQTIEGPDEILPNIGTEEAPHRSKSVLFVKQNEKDYISIVEATPGETQNILWNFWKMEKKRAENYFKKFRKEKARLIQSGGRPAPHIPHNMAEAKVGKPEGLSGGQTEPSGFNNNIGKEGPTVKPLTKREKALQEYKAYTESFTPEQKEIAGDLIEDEPKSPSGQLLKIKRALAKTEKQDAEVKPGTEQAPFEVGDTVAVKKGWGDLKPGDAVEVAEINELNDVRLIKRVSDKETIDYGFTRDTNVEVITDEKKEVKTEIKPEARKESAGNADISKNKVPDRMLGRLIHYAHGNNQTFDGFIESQSYRYTREALEDAAKKEGFGSLKEKWDYQSPHREKKESEQHLPEKEPIIESQSVKAESLGKPGSSDKMALWVEKKLKEDKQITSGHLFNQANKAFGGTQAEGAYTSKDAYDAVELGINRYLMRNIEFKSPEENVKFLKDLVEKLPTQTKRTKEQVEFQQFSTPPALAYIANFVANIQNNDVYLEPSAGVGGLAVFGRMSNADKVYGNELSKRRAELLKFIGLDGVFTEDAEQLDNVLPEDVKPTVIVMNPPFSATGGRLKNNTTKHGAKHIEQALHRLEPNGRLVAIVGKGMADDAPAFRAWWKKIKENYNVRANIGISGKDYKKYGTTFDNQILVIDKTDQRTDNVITGKVESFENLLPLLKEVRDDRPQVPEPSQEDQLPTSKPSRSEAIETSQRGTSHRDGSLRTTSELGAGPREGLPGRGTRGTGAESVTGESESIGGLPQDERDASGAESGRDGGRGNGNVARRDDRGQIPVEPEESEIEFEDTVSGKRKDVITDSIYDPYQPKLNIKGSKPHPTPLVQSAAMADTELPSADYKPDIPQLSITSGKISNAQLEAIVYAGRAHSEMLPDGKTRKGFFIGDGTGVGKGREIASIMWDNWRNGRKKAVWISETAKLENDAKRDLEGVGWKGGAEKVFSLNKTKLGENVKNNEGILFTTYSTMRSNFENVRLDEPKTFENMRVRINQIAEWLGDDFDGVIAFDESHNMGNATAIKGTRGTTKPAQKALAGLLLQDRLPNARILYVSATGATEVMNLSYATRLGLWGEGTPFSTKENFVSSITSGGIAGMELVARDMKSMGLYMARSLSYDGVSYDRLVHDLTPQQRDMYNEMAGAWQIVLQNIEAALSETGGKNSSDQKKYIYGQFWGAQQRFFNQIITSMQMPSAIQAIKKDIKDGHAVILQLVNTNEAQSTRALARREEGQDLEDLDITPRESLMEYLRKSFPVDQFEEYTDDNGNTRSRPVVDSKGNRIQNRQAVQMRDELLMKLGSIRVPSGPLEIIMDELGHQNVAEVTGRTRRIVHDEKEGKKVIQKWSDAKSANDADLFMKDKKQVLVFSEKGGTGRSYHADQDAKNQRKRKHYLIQPGWRADKAVQGLGRSHRSNQKQPPEYILVTTDLKGQKRFLSSIARRLDQLGALTKGQRQTGSQGIFQARDNLESQYAKDALRRFFEDLSASRIEGLNIHDFQYQTGLKLTDENGRLRNDTPTIQQFLNRLLSMNIDEQNKTFDAFSARLDAVIQAHAENGTLDVGIETIRGDKIEKVSEKVVIDDKETGAKTKYVQVDVTNPARIHDFKASKSIFHKNAGYYKNAKSGKLWISSPVREKTDKYGEVKKYVTLVSPANTRRSVEKDTINSDKWIRLSEKEAKQLWDKEYKELPKTETTRTHIITGTLLPIWDRLKGHSTIYRMQTDSGERLLGRVIHPDHLQDVLGNLGVGAEKIELSGEELAQRVLNGDTARLANGWKLKKKRVSGESRIEIIGPAYHDLQVLQDQGAFTEQINWQTRFFIPTGGVAGAVIDRITKSKPVVQIDSKYSGPNLTEDALYSTKSLSQTPPQNAGITNLFQVNLNTIKSHPRFKTATVTQGDDGVISVRFKNNLGFTINSIDSVDENSVTLNADYGRYGLKPGEKVAGFYDHKDKNITIVEGVGDRYTIDHEFEHFLEKSGVLTPMDIEALSREMEKIGLTPNEETRARYLEEACRNRDAQTGHMARIVQKVIDFIDMIINQFHRTARGVLRDIESGKIGDHAAIGDKINEFAQSAAYSVKEAVKKITDNPGFVKWFGDSKVVDENGEPLVVYHGTTMDFAAFDLAKRGTRTGLDARHGFFFAGKPEIASNYAKEFGKDAKGGQVMPVYLSLQNPLQVDYKSQRVDHSKLEKVIKFAKQKGHDGVVVHNIKDGAIEDNQYVAFDPHQIKSIFNKGSFDPDNSNVLYSTKEHVTYSTGLIPSGPEVARDIQEDRSFANRIFEQRDVAVHRAQVEVQDLQKKVQALAGKKSRRRHPLGFAYDKKLQRSRESDALDMALMVWRDLQANPDKADEFKTWADGALKDPETSREQKLSIKKQLSLLDRSLNLTDEQKALADEIGELFDKAYTVAKANKVVSAFRDNYVRRIWKVPKGKEGHFFSSGSTGYGFKTFTTARMQRKLETIVDGWMAGYELGIKGLTNSYGTYLQELETILANKDFIVQGYHTRDIDGLRLFSTSRKGSYSDYVELKAPGFKVWEWAGKVTTEVEPDEEGALLVDDYGRKFFYGAIEKLPETWAVYKVQDGKKSKKALRVFESEEDAEAFAAGKDYETSIEYRSAKEFAEAWEERKLYAPKPLADIINKMTATDRLFSGIPGLDAMARFNAGMKSWILLSSFFHHMAGARSWVFGVHHGWKKKKAKNPITGEMIETAGANPVAAYKAGLKKIEDRHAIIELGVKNGLTLGEMQDWSERALRKETGFAETLANKLGLARTSKVMEQGRFYREKFTDSLFKKYFAGLKAEAFTMEFIHELQKAQDAWTQGKGKRPDIDAVAERTARLINADFGGLHLQRMGRNPTVQKMARLLLLAPDWTESNFRTVTGMVPGLNKWINRIIGDVPGPPGMDKIYRKFWARVALRIAVSTLLSQMLLNGADDSEDFWKEQALSNRLSKYRWTEVDVSKIYHALEIDTEAARKTLSLGGHFFDPLKLFDPASLIKHKASPAVRVAEAVMSGSDWAERPFTGVKALFGTRQTIKKSPHEEKEGFYSRLPATVVNQVTNLQPVQVGYFLRYLQGEQDGLTAILRSMGTSVHTAWPAKITTPIVAKWDGEDRVYEAIKDLMDKGVLHMGPPAGKITVGGILRKLTRKQYQEYIEKSSDLARVKLQATILSSKWKLISPERQAAAIETVIKSARKKIRAKLKKKIWRDFMVKNAA